MNRPIGPAALADVYLFGGLTALGTLILLVATATATDGALQVLAAAGVALLAIPTATLFVLTRFARLADRRAPIDPYRDLSLVDELLLESIAVHVGLRSGPCRCYARATPEGAAVPPADVETVTEYFWRANLLEDGRTRYEPYVEELVRCSNCSANYFRDRPVLVEDPEAEFGPDEARTREPGEAIPDLVEASGRRIRRATGAHEPGRPGAGRDPEAEPARSRSRSREP